MLEIIKKNKIWIILAVILAVGIFLRTYNFSDWLFFQADQARDLSLVERTLREGPGSLPLLGPKAGGTYLRLGPVFYYFQYFSGLIFGMDEPYKAAYPDLFFSILTIPLLFLFLCKFFSKGWSLATAAAHSVCFFAIQYSRFAWNPNSLPFFNLLFFYSVLNFFESEQKNKKIIWTVIASIAYSIASQLHFVCLFSFPLAFFILLIAIRFVKKELLRRTLRYLPIAILILFIFYIPVILSDIHTSGNNSINFLDSFGKKVSDDEFVSLAKTSIFNFSKYFAIIWSGIIDAPKKIYKYAAYFIAAGAVAGIMLWRKEGDARKKIFLASIFAWLASYAAVYFSLGSKVQPRHFLPILPLPFIFWSWIILAAYKKINLKIAPYIAAIFLFFPIILNAHSVKTWFGELSGSQKTVTTPRKSGLLKAVEGESWWHLKQTAAYIKEDCEKSRIIIIPPKHSYRSLVDYSLENIGEIRDWAIKWGTIEYSPDYCYYHIYFSHNDYSDRFDWQIRAIREESFGDMSVRRFIILPETLTGKSNIYNPFRKEKIEKKDFQEKELISEGDIDDEAKDDESEIDLDDETQEKNFDGLADEKNIKNDEIEEEIDNEEMDADEETNDSALILEDVVKKDRVFWRDLFK